MRQFFVTYRTDSATERVHPGDPTRHIATHSDRVTNVPFDRNFASSRPRGDAVATTAGDYFVFLSPDSSVERAAMKASWGTSTRPTIFIRFLPSFCFSSSLRLRVMSPP